MFEANWTDHFLLDQSQPFYYLLSEFLYQKNMSLLTGRRFFKPFTYSRFFQRWETHEKSHWMPSEAPMAEDVVDWEKKLSPNQKDFLTNIFRFFTQGDIEVASAYYTEYLPLIKLPEVTMMMGSFAAREAVHIAAYSYLIETLGMPESTYSEFLKINEMRDKQEYLTKFSECNLVGKKELTLEDKEHFAISIGLFSGGVEGIQLFSSFAMLLLFPLNGLMKGMGQIMTWSITDETQHVDGMLDVFQTFLAENPDIDVKALEPKMHRVIDDLVNLERAFIKLIFNKYDSKEFFGMTPEKLEKYIEYVADHRLYTMGFEKLYKTSTTNPLPEMAVMTNAPTHTNFFESTPTDYSLGSCNGTWADVWGKGT